MQIHTAICATLISVMLVASPARAGNWVVNTTAFGTTVSNEVTGESFKAVNEKAGNKQAKRLNNIEDKAAKKDGVMASADGPCADPSSGVLC